MIESLNQIAGEVPQFPRKSFTNNSKFLLYSGDKKDRHLLATCFFFRPNVSSAKPCEPVTNKARPLWRPKYFFFLILHSTTLQRIIHSSFFLWCEDTGKENVQVFSLWVPSCTSSKPPRCTHRSDCILNSSEFHVFFKTENYFKNSSHLPPPAHINSVIFDFPCFWNIRLIKASDAYLPRHSSLFITRRSCLLNLYPGNSISATSILICPH